MGNTPSNQSGQGGPSGNASSPARRGSTSQGLRSSPAQPSRSQASSVLPHRHHAGRHSQRSEAAQGSPSSINQTSSSPSSHRPISPRRRKSLELPDLNNKLTFTNANAQGATSELVQAEALDTHTTGSGRVRSPLAGPPPSAYPYDEESSLGNTPANSKRISLTSGTRARSPQSATVQITTSLGEGMGRDGSGSMSSVGTREGMPIPGAKPARRAPFGGDEPDNPYFPPVARQRPPTTPGLPNYSHSPHTGDGGSGVGLAHVEHAEQADFDFSGRDRLSVNTNVPPTGPRQPSPARPAPAVVTTEHHHDVVAPQDVIVSALPNGMANNPILDQNAPLPPALETPLASVQTPRIYDPDQTPLGLPPAVGNAARPVEEEEESASIPTLVTWNEGGRNVYVTGTFAENGWKARLKMNKSTHDFSLLLNLPPGTHRLKFIVDDHWRCSSELQTATDGDGNLVNWLEVDPPKKQIDSHEDWAMAEWAQKVSGAEMEQDDGSLWTTVIPPALVNFISIEERGKESPDGLNPGAFEKYQQNMQQLLATVPAPPTVPRHLKDPILNTSPKELEGTIGGTAGDDNSILPVPNHVVLNHLTAAAIRNGTLAVGTTTRYKRKYISTLLFKPVDH